MLDRESSSLEAAARLARDADPGGGRDRYADRLEADREAALDRLDEHTCHDRCSCQEEAHERLQEAEAERAPADPRWPCGNIGAPQPQSVTSELVGELRQIAEGEWPETVANSEDGPSVDVMCWAQGWLLTLADGQNLFRGDDTTVDRIADVLSRHGSFADLLSLPAETRRGYRELARLTLHAALGVQDDSPRKAT